MTHTNARYSTRVALDRMEQKIDHLHDLLHALQKGQNKMSAEMDRLATEVAENKTVTTSAVNLLRRLGTIIRANANDPAKLRALADELNANETDLALAVAENTVAEEEVPPPVEEPPVEEPPVDPDPQPETPPVDDPEQPV